MESHSSRACYPRVGHFVEHVVREARSRQRAGSTMSRLRLHRSRTLLHATTHGEVPAQTFLRTPSQIPKRRRGGARRGTKTATVDRRATRPQAKPCAHARRETERTQRSPAVCSLGAMASAANVRARQAAGGPHRGGRRYLRLDRRRVPEKSGDDDQGAAAGPEGGRAQQTADAVQDARR